MNERDLRYAYRSGFGHVGWHIETVDSAGAVGEFASLALDSSGRAHISYYDRSNADLKYACKLADGWHVETVDSLGDTGEHTSLALGKAGYPHISYFDATNGDLKYAYRDASGWHTQPVDAEGEVGSYTSLAFDASGYAHISYHDATRGHLKYAYRDASGWYTETVDSAGYTGMYSSLSLDGSGHPHISYRDQAMRILYTAMNESSGWISEQVDWSIDSQGPTSLALDELGSPHIGYEWAPGAIFPHVRPAYKDSIWHIDSLPAAGCYASLAIAPNGQLHLSFHDIRNPEGGLTHAYAEELAAEDGPASESTRSGLIQHAGWSTQEWPAPAVMSLARLWLLTSWVGDWQRCRCRGREGRGMPLWPLAFPSRPPPDSTF